MYIGAGGYILGFRLDPVEKLEELVVELTKFHSLFAASPIFGVEFTIEDQPDASTSEVKMAAPVSRVEEDVELTDDAEDTQVLAAYYAVGHDGWDEQVIQFDESLGLAVERLQDGLTMESLWRIV